MNGIINRQAKTHGAENRHRHIVILANQTDHTVNHAHGQRQRNHRQQAEQQRTEQHCHHNQHDHKGTHKRAQHAHHHFVLPDHIDKREPEPFGLDAVRRRIGGQILIQRGHHCFHILIITTGELQPEIGVAVIRRDKMPKIMWPVAVLVSNQCLANRIG